MKYYIYVYISFINTIHITCTVQFIYKECAQKGTEHVQNNRRYFVHNSVIKSLISFCEISMSIRSCLSLTKNNSLIVSPILLFWS
jgi:hypothetical protein